MTRPVIVIIIFLSILTFGIVEISYVSNFITKFDAQIKQIDYICTFNKDDLTQSAPEIKKVKDEWKNELGKMSLIFDYKNLQPIGEGLTKLHTYALNNDYQNAKVEINLIKTHNERNKEVLGFNLNNIF